MLSIFEKFQATQIELFQEPMITRALPKIPTKTIKPKTKGTQIVVMVLIKRSGSQLDAVSSSMTSITAPFVSESTVMEIQLKVYFYAAYVLPLTYYAWDSEV